MTLALVTVHSSAIAKPNVEIYSHIDGRKNLVVAQYENLNRWRTKCESNASTADVIAACTWVIRSGREDERYLPLYYYNRGVKYRQIGMNKSAIDDFSQAIRLNHNFYDAYFNRAHSYLEENNLEQALEDVSEAINLNPRMTNAYGFRGMVFELLGRATKALTDFKRYCELGGRDKAVAKKMGNRCPLYHRKRTQN